MKAIKRISDSKNICIPVFAVVLILSLSCKKSEPTPAPQTDYTVQAPKYLDTLERQYGSFNQAIYNLMKSIYFWNSLVPKIDYNASIYTDKPDVLLDDLKNKQLDKFSFIADKQTTQDLFNEGKETGKGIGYDVENEFTIKVSYVYPGSPGENAGVYRGMTLKKINEIDAVQSYNDGSIGTNLGQATINFEFTDSLGATKKITVTDGAFNLKTVVKKNIITQGNTKIGYLLFNSFLGTAEQELNDAFAYFKENNISELVLDLRYNGGGLVSVANQLAGSIAGDQVKGKVFLNYVYNDDLKGENSPYYFTTVTSALNLSRVFIIGSKQTASASELVINCLKPYIDVKLIGYITYGKPVGFVGFTYKDKIFFPVLFKSANANGESDYYNGITPDKYSIDGLNYQLGDLRENRLAEALYYIKNGVFTADNARFSMEQKEPLVPKGLKSAIGTF